jgi:signal transduction histidine kinase
MSAALHVLDMRAARLAGELLISTERNSTNGVILAVRDSGPGIDPENLERIFDAFYTTKSSGVGMGLWICRSIIETHGGRLWADANEPRARYFSSPCLPRIARINLRRRARAHRDRPSEKEWREDDLPALFRRLSAKFA